MAVRDHFHQLLVRVGGLSDDHGTVTVPGGGLGVDRPDHSGRVGFVTRPVFVPAAPKNGPAGGPAYHHAVDAASSLSSGACACGRRLLPVGSHNKTVSKKKRNSEDCINGSTARG